MIKQKVAVDEGAADRKCIQEILLVTGMATVKLSCPVPGCALGTDGGKYETEPLAEERVMQMLNLHLQYNHREEGGVQQQPTVTGGVGPKVEKVPRPTLSKGLSEDKFVHFERLWKRHRRSVNL